jgi:hypothetical protein
MELKFTDGSSRRLTIPVETWNHRGDIRFHEPLERALDKVILDPDHALPDDNRLNNVFTLMP